MAKLRKGGEGYRGIAYAPVRKPVKTKKNKPLEKALKGIRKAGKTPRLNVYGDPAARPKG